MVSPKIARNPPRLRQSLVVATIACRLEELIEHVSSHSPLAELEQVLQFSANILLQILQFTDQIESLAQTELTQSKHSQSCPAFTAGHVRCTGFTTTPAATDPSISEQTDSSRSDSQRPVLLLPRIWKPLTSKTWPDTSSLVD